MKTYNKGITPIAELYDCERCGWTFYKHELVMDGNEGILVCPTCYDEPFPVSGTLTWHSQE